MCSILPLALPAQGAAVNGGTDNFDVTGLQVFVEDGTTPGYQPGEDTATFINALQPMPAKPSMSLAMFPERRLQATFLALF